MYLALLDDVQEVAVKVLKMEAGASPSKSQLRQFEAEIAIMRAARFRNVVSFIGAHLGQVGDCQQLVIVAM